MPCPPPGPVTTHSPVQGWWHRLNRDLGDVFGGVRRPGGGGSGGDGGSGGATPSIRQQYALQTGDPHSGINTFKNDLHPLKASAMPAAAPNATLLPELDWQQQS